MRRHHLLKVLWEGNEKELVPCDGSLGKSRARGREGGKAMLSM